MPFSPGFLRTLFSALAFSAGVASAQVHDAGMTVRSRYLNQPLQTHTEACATATCTLTMPIPFPVTGALEVDSTGGRIRGRARMEKTDASFAELSGVVSYSTMAHIDFLEGSPVTIMDGARMTMTAAVALQNGVVTAMQGTKVPDVSTVSTTTSIKLSGGAAATFFGDSIVNSGGSVAQSGEQHRELSATLTATDGMVSDFEIGVTHRIDFSLREGGTLAESDFSHTIEFLDLRFYSPQGADITQWVSVSFDDPNFYMASVAPIPEPETYAMLLAGLGLLAFHRRRKELGSRAVR